MKFKFGLLILLVFFNGGFCQITNETIVDVLGTGITIVESGILEIGEMFAGPMATAGIKFLKVIPSIIKGQIPETDEQVQQLKEFSSKLEKQINELGGTIMEELNFIEDKGELRTFLQDLNVNSKVLAKTSKTVLTYNVSQATILAFTNLCIISDSSPIKMTEIIYQKLIRPCNKSFTISEIQRYNSAIRLMDDTGLTIEEKSAVALIVMENPLDNLTKLITRFKEIRTNDEENDRSVGNTLRKFSAEYPPYSKCLLRVALLGKSCNRQDLIATIDTVADAMSEMAYGTLVCAAATITGAMDQKEYFEKQLAKYREFMVFQKNFYDETVANLHSLCEENVLKYSVEAFPKSDSKDEIVDVRYPELANFILENLRVRGHPRLLRHVIAMPSLDDDTRFYYNCQNTTECLSFNFVNRSVRVFTSIHKRQLFKKLNQDEFLNANVEEIGKTIKLYQNANYITDVTARLDLQNISISGNDRASKQIWLRNYQWSWPCSFKSFVSTNSVSTVHGNLSYYWDHAGSTADCEAYTIYYII